MKTKLFSLALALALCLGLTVPAAAGDSQNDVCVSMWLKNEAQHLRQGQKVSGSGQGWNWNGQALTIHNVSDAYSLNVAPLQDLTIALEGSSSLSRAFFSSTGTKNVTFEGSGECVFYEYAAPDQVLPFSCEPGVKFTLKDGLVITGGREPGDAYPLTFQIGDGYFWGVAYLVTPDGNQATYVRIAPGNGTGTTVMQPLSMPTRFQDVPASSPYLEAIKWALEKGITKGKTADTFGPNDLCTVSHIVHFLAAANGETEGSDGYGIWYWAIESGFIQGNFDEYTVPESVYNAPCTRAMAVTYMWKAAGRPAPKTISSFSDVPASASYAKAVSWAVEQGITKGTTPTTFSPNSTCTRGQIVTFLHRASK